LPVSSSSNYTDVNHPQAQDSGEHQVFLPFVINGNVGGVQYGLAAAYPGDHGIANHPSVIFTSGFETSDWAKVDFGYTGGSRWWISQVTNSGLAFFGSGVLQYQNIAGTHAPGIHKIHEFGDKDTVFLRWYRRYESGYDFSCQSKTNGVYALAPGVDSSASAGIPPNGYDKYSAKLQVWKRGEGGFEPRIYTYHPDQSRIYGDSLSQNVGDPLTLQADRWYSFEIMLKSNDAGQRNGEIKLWIDGVLKGHYTDMRFRDTNALKINELEITAYMGGQCTAPKDQRIWDDNLVLATEYIGPMVELEGIIIDDSDRGFSTSFSQDMWQEYTKVGGQHYGISHHYNRQIGSGQDTATWSFTVPEPGNYDIYAWWWDDDWRPADVPYTVNHSDGSTTVRVDQRANGGQWNLLGTFYFQDEGSVVVSDDVSLGRDIVADAIQLVYSSEGPLPTTTPTLTPTSTPTPTATNTPLPTYTPTPTSTSMPSPTNTPTPTNTPNPTATSTPLPTNRPTSVPTNTSAPTNTPLPTNTPTLAP
jgi:hypothetical protein